MRGKQRKELKDVEFKYNTAALSQKILIGTPTLGRIRFEWAAARYGQVIPINWQIGDINVTYQKPYEIYPGYVPIGYSVADAFNIITRFFMEQNYEWLLTVEDDVIVPRDLYVRVRDYTEKAEVPVVSGLYFTKGKPSEPLVFRGRGNGAFKDFKLGEKVWADGVPMGCLLIHRSVLKHIWDNSPEYLAGGNEKTRMVFETPRKIWKDPKTGLYNSAIGTQDLYWCDRVMKEDVLGKTGWKDVAKRKWPFLVDTEIFCRHIDLASGAQYP